jgi:hypothetical protein
MNTDQNNAPLNLLDAVKKIGIYLLIILIVIFYALCYHQFTN